MEVGLVAELQGRIRLRHSKYEAHSFETVLCPKFEVVIISIERGQAKLRLAHSL
jgi:hypothetical protein